MSIIELAENTRVKTFHPPADLDPLTASPKELAQAGFPSRPTDPLALASYHGFFARNKNKLHYIEPEFRLEPKPRQSRNRVQTDDLLNEWSTNWSGVLVHPPGGDSISCVTAQWNVPTILPNANDGWEMASCWVGIDGWEGDRSFEVAQAGVLCSVRQNGSETDRDYNAWFEWYPDSPDHPIANLPVSPGDHVGVTIQAVPGFRGVITVARVFFSNATTGASTSFEIESPQDVSLAGVSAEFVVETPSVDNRLVGLPIYEDVWFTDAMAGTVGKKTLYPGDGDTVFLQRSDAAGNPSGPVLSRGEIAGFNTVRCQYTGPL